MKNSFPGLVGSAGGTTPLFSACCDFQSCGFYDSMMWAWPWFISLPEKVRIVGTVFVVGRLKKGGGLV